MFSTTTASFNTAVGAGALDLNTGDENTAVGVAALLLNAGTQNTAVGVDALGLNTTGESNAAVGAFALYNNTTGGSNTANGFQALQNNTAGNGNTANGYLALISNTVGSSNTADGDGVLLDNITGNGNTAVGTNALASNHTGNGNTALGTNSGVGILTANEVTCIGAGVAGADVSNTTWISNVYGVTTQNGTTAPVIVSADGQLGTAPSSARFKKDIATMEKASEGILSLRPVTFHYKTDIKGTPQFGLIAEEVAKVDPALVLPDKEGKPYSVRYEAVNAMLLNEFLKEHRKVEEQESRIGEQEARIARQQKQIDALTAGLQKVSAQLELNKPAPQTVLNNQ